MSRKILIVGAVNLGTPPANGEEYKNQELIGYLSARHKIHIIDTHRWSREPVTLIRLLWHMIFVRYDRIILSASSASVFRLLDALRFLKQRMQRTIYFVIGGYFPRALQEGRYKARAYQDLSSIVVEGEQMKSDLVAAGIDTRIHVVPNFKKVGKTWMSPEKFDQHRVRFIFMSRISVSKGLDTIFEALQDPLLSGRADDFCIDFYGPVEAEYKAEFQQRVDQFPNCRYKGYLDFAHQPEASYREMSGYHVMLFPTYWMGEGFPGAVIDAFMCGIPVIATDWNMNREVIHNGETGRLIPVKNPGALAAAMLDAIDQRGEWKTMSEKCLLRANDYDTDKVLGHHLKHII